MSKKKILLVRSTPNDLDINGYNVQQVGLGKVFCDMGYDSKKMVLLARSLFFMKIMASRLLALKNLENGSLGGVLIWKLHRRSSLHNMI